jgi:hypothetical protein
MQNNAVLHTPPNISKSKDKLPTFAHALIVRHHVSPRRNIPPRSAYSQHVGSPGGFHERIHRFPVGDGQQQH